MLARCNRCEVTAPAILCSACAEKAGTDTYAYYCVDCVVEHGREEHPSVRREDGLEKARQVIRQCVKDSGVMLPTFALFSGRHTGSPCIQADDKMIMITLDHEVATTWYAPHKGRRIGQVTHIRPEAAEDNSEKK